MPGLTVAEIAEMCGGELNGDGGRIVSGASTPEDASEQDLAFLSSPKYAGRKFASKAACLLVFPEFALQGSWALIRTSEPRAAFASALRKLYPQRQLEAFRHPTAIIHPSAKIGSDVYIGAYVTIEDDSTIGDGCYIDDHASIGKQVHVGERSELRPHVVVYDRVRIGARCLIHAGCVIGADGFGFALQGDRYEKFPQIGTVEIGDDVELGANTCVDRASLGVTRIGDGTKLDNLVHIAHNCQIGRHVVIAAQTGLSGGVVVGDYAVIGGQVGIGDKAHIEAKAVIGSQGGILPSKRVSAGEPLWGTPARPLRNHLKSLAMVNKLPQLLADVARLNRDLLALHKRVLNDETPPKADEGSDLSGRLRL